MVTRINLTTGAILATIDLAPLQLYQETSLGAGEGGVWAATAGPGWRLVRIDPKTNRLAATYAIPEGGGPVRAGLGGVWVVYPTKKEARRTRQRASKSA